MSSKIERKIKKIQKRHLQSFKLLRAKDTRLSKWKGRLVTIHYCSDERKSHGELCKHYDADHLDGYLLHGKYYVFFQILSETMWEGLEIKKPCIKFRRRINWYRSIPWPINNFCIYTRCRSITTEILSKTILFIENWIDEHEEFMNAANISQSSIYLKLNNIAEIDICLPIQ